MLGSPLLQPNISCPKNQEIGFPCSNFWYSTIVPFHIRPLVRRTFLNAMWFTDLWQSTWLQLPLSAFNRQIQIYRKIRRTRQRFPIPSCSRMQSPLWQTLPAKVTHVCSGLDVSLGITTKTHVINGFLKFNVKGIYITQSQYLKMGSWKWLAQTFRVELPQSNQGDMVRGDKDRGTLLLALWCSARPWTLPAQDEPEEPIPSWTEKFQSHKPFHSLISLQWWKAE